MTREKSQGWCCELCGILLTNKCDNTNGYVTCPDEDCITEGERQEEEQ